LYTNCRQLKLYSGDGKKYLNDVIDETGIKKLGLILLNKNNKDFLKWIEGGLGPIDEQSKRKAHSLFESDILGHRMGILGCSTAEMKMSLGC